MYLQLGFYCNIELQLCKKNCKLLKQCCYDEKGSIVALMCIDIIDKLFLKIFPIWILVPHDPYTNYETAKCYFSAVNFDTSLSSDDMTIAWCTVK